MYCDLKAALLGSSNTKEFYMAKGTNSHKKEVKKPKKVVPKPAPPASRRGT